MSALYLHVPFCVRRCLYCDFYVVPLGTGPLPRRLRDFRHLHHRAFLKALEAECRALPADFRPKTLYIGGGTPTEMPADDLRRLLQILEDHINLSHVREFTIEANPGTLDEAITDVIRNSAIDRVSLGVQSFDNPTLERLGRIHDADEAFQAVHLLRQADIRNISIDLLFAIPGADDAVIATNLAALNELNPEHVSWYSLEFEPGTAFTEMRDKGFLTEPDDQQAHREYRHIRRGLREAGFQQYELFSFTRARPCQHNINYWQGGEFLGVGPSAHSHQQATRWANPADLTQWTQSWLKNIPPPTQPETLSPLAKARERLMTQLRLTQGIHIATFTEQTHHNPLDLIPPATRQQWAEQNLLLQSPTHLRLHPSAYLISDSLFREFF